MGSKNKSVTVGYRYFMGVHAALCHGPVDAVTELIVGERSAWSGSVTSSSRILVNKPDLFGGDKREGGVYGQVDIMMGEPTQPKNDYLMQLHGPTIPAYRGLLTTVFRRFLWSSMNPYFKAPWWRVKRILAGWSRGAAWYPSKAAIGSYDINPAHIIYQCLTDTEWGMGYNPTDIDGVSFTAVADKLYSENFGLSMLWGTQTSIQDFVSIVLDHVNGVLHMDLSTGKLALKLFRDDYVIADLPHLNPSNILSFDSFQRVAWGDTANEIVVVYTGRDEEELSIAVQDLASIEAQGGIVSVTREYRGVREADLAVRLAMRDLNVSCTPLAKVTLVCNRIAWDWNIGTVFKLSWPKLGISEAPFRLVAINKGSLLEGRIQIDAVEDIFGLPTAGYADQQPSGWVDPISPPTPITSRKLVEAPYWDVVQVVPEAERAYLDPQYGFGEYIAAAPTNDAMNFLLNASATSGGTYSEVGAGDFSPTGTLVNAISHTDTSILLANMLGIDLITEEGYGYIDDECVAVTSVDPDTGVGVIRRGVLDTVPAPHSAGARLFFVGPGYLGNDPTERVSGETVYYKGLTQTSYGVLPLSSATAASLVMNNRASRPYPPGQFKINGSYWPANISGAMSSTWAHRDRLQQTVDLVDYTQGNIGPEAGTTYTVRVYSGATLKRTYSGISTTSWTYPEADAIADGYLQTVRVTLTSARGGVESWQLHDHTVERYGLGFHLGESLGGSVPA